MDAAVRVVQHFAGQADEAGLDLLLFPECFLQGYLVTDEHVRAQAVELAGARFATVLSELSRAAVVVAGGRVVGSYRKTFLPGLHLARSAVRDQHLRRRPRQGVGPSCVIAATGQVVAQVPIGTVGIAIAEINQECGSPTRRAAGRRADAVSAIDSARSGMLPMRERVRRDIA